MKQEIINKEEEYVVKVLESHPILSLQEIKTLMELMEVLREESANHEKERRVKKELASEKTLQRIVDTLERIEILLQNLNGKSSSEDDRFKRYQTY